MSDDIQAYFEHVNRRPGKDVYVLSKGSNQRGKVFLVKVEAHSYWPHTIVFIQRDLQ